MIFDKGGGGRTGKEEKPWKKSGYVKGGGLGFVFVSLHSTLFLIDKKLN